MQAHLRRIYLLPVILGLAAAAIGTALIATPAVGQTNVSYTVEVENLTDGQPFTPPVVAIHSSDADLFETGEAASSELQAIAENGNNDPMLTLLDGSDAVHNTASGTAPVMPGESATITIEGPSDGLISAAMMLICTNDGFTGLDSVELPDTGSETIDANAYDAGTEMNTEDFSDMVPPCQELVGVMSDDDGTGESNPDIAEGGTVSSHSGIQGGSDLTTEDHGWTDPVARITVTAAASQLPDTGGAPLDGSSGIGWTLYMAIGGALLLAGGSLFVTARRHTARQ